MTSRGDRIQGGRLEKRAHNGGLCQNCHGLEAGEVNVGNIGPALTGYVPEAVVAFLGRRG